MAGIEKDILLCERREHVAYITLNRPERRNALSLALQAALVQAFSDAGEDDETWAIVLTGAGDRAFCAGGDLKEMDEIAREKRRFPVPMTGLHRNVFEAVLETYKPTIAALNGPAVAGGCELALACDMRIAAAHATIGMPEAKIGMGANFASVLLPRLVPRAIAFQMLYTGESLTAEEAARHGLFNAVVAKEALAGETERLVRAIVANAPLSLRRYKEMASKGWELSVHAALRLNAGPNPYLSEDREEGIRARLERRPPRWRGR